MADYRKQEAKGFKIMESVNNQHLERELKVQETANNEISDRLSMERTQLANERTLLSYMRTSMGFVLGGFSLIQFFQNQVFMWVGALFIPAGIILSIIGLKKFIDIRASLVQHRANYTPTSHVRAQVAAEARRNESQEPNS